MPIPTPIIAEIADKMPETSIVWLFDFSIAIVLLASASGLWFLHRWAHLLLLPVAAWWAWMGFSDYALDAYWRRAVSQEMGTSYVVQSVAAGCLPLLVIVGFALALFRRCSIERS
ncbi:MAG: hypothetical protein WED34_19195 [Planctomycetales bacterium]